MAKEMTPGLHGKISSSQARKRAASIPEGTIGSREFFTLMRLRHREGPERVDRLINGRHVCDVVVMMCDSSGFSRKTHAYGILQFLSVMTHCYDRLIPILEKEGGLCLSHNADNILALFPSERSAVDAAVAMHRWLLVRNEGLEEKDQFNICIGIHKGPVVRLKENVFGATVNVAARIGEDLAGRDEIIITGRTAKALGAARKAKYLRTQEIGGESFELHRVEY